MAQAPGYSRPSGGASLPSTSALLKGDGAGGAAAATAGTDYPGLATGNTFTVGQKVHGSANESQLDLKNHSTQTVPLMRALSNAGVRQCFMGAGHWNAGSDDYRMQVGNNGLGLYSVLRICWGAGGPYSNDGDMFNVADTGLRRAAAGFVSPCAGNNNNGAGIEFIQIATPSAPSTNGARQYAKDVSGTAELFGMDEGGTETQQTPHAIGSSPFPEDLSDPFPYIFQDTNYYVGVTRYINISRMAYLLQRLFPNEPIVVERDLPKDQWWDWDAEQSKLQARYNAERAAEIEAREKAIRQAALARRASIILNHMRAEAQAAGVEQVEIDKLEPLAADLEAARAEIPSRVRPVADIRKPAPAWLKPRMADDYDNTAKPKPNWKQRLLAWLLS